MLGRLLRTLRLKSFKSSRIVKTKKHVYKIVWGPYASMLENEFLAFESGSSSDYFWHGFGCYYNRVFSLFLQIYLVRSERLYGRPSYEEMDNFILKLLERINDDAPYRPVLTTFEESRVDKLLGNLSNGNREYLIERTKDIYVPVTGAHGDFTDGNVRCDEKGAIYLIDWDRYRENGSVVSDILRLYLLRGWRILKDQGYDRGSFDPRIPMPIPNAVCSKLDALGCKKSDLGILAALSNLCFRRNDRIGLQKRLVKFDRILGEMREMVSKDKADGRR